jgi:hypothetical protein
MLEADINTGYFTGLKDFFAIPELVTLLEDYEHAGGTKSDLANAVIPKIPKDLNFSSGAIPGAKVTWKGAAKNGKSVQFTGLGNDSLT